MFGEPLICGLKTSQLPVLQHSLTYNLEGGGQTDYNPGWLLTHYLILKQKLEATVFNKGNSGKSDTFPQDPKCILQVSDLQFYT